MQVCRSFFLSTMSARLKNGYDAYLNGIYAKKRACEESRNWALITVAVAIITWNMSTSMRNVTDFSSFVQLIDILSFQILRFVFLFR